MISPAHVLRRLGNELFKFAYPLYRPLYRAFKSHGDRWERNLLRKILKPGNIVVDGGANIGIYSRFLSTCVGATGKVHCFEPDPLNFSRLAAGLSEQANAIANEIAVSDRTGESVLYLSASLNVDHRTYPSSDTDRRTIVIQTVRLDDYFTAGDRVDLIKLDIQGYEQHALQGAERVLRDNPEIKLLFEFWPYGLAQAGIGWRDLVSYLQNRGFHLSEISSSGLDDFRADTVEESPDWYLNLFAAR